LKLSGLLAARNLQLSALPQIAINLVTQAKLVKSRTILSGDWPLQNLQKELEGVSYQMIHIRKKDMKLAGIKHFISAEMLKIKRSLTLIF